MINDEHRRYLDDLQESGKTNMYAAGSWLQDQFGIGKDEARTILVHWMIEKQAGNK